MSVRLSLDGFGPLTVAAARTLIAAVSLALIGALMGQSITKLKGTQIWAFVVGTGVIGTAIPFVCLSWGQQFVPSAFAGVAMGAVPLMVLPLVAMFSPEEGIGPRRIAGMLLGFVGLALLIGPGAMASSGSELETFGRIACLSAAGCYAAASVITRRSPKMPPIAFAAGTLCVAAVLLGPLALVVEGLPEHYPLSPSLALLYAALFPTALAAVIRVRVITTAGSLFMSLTSYQVPVWSVIFGITLMGESLPPQLFYALALILAGIGLSQWSNLRRSRR